MRKITRSRYGFSLMELSVALGVIALMAGFGITMSSNIASGSSRIETQQRLVTIRLALDNYAKMNGYLPCPADRTEIPTSTSFGLELRSASGTACDVASPGMVQVTDANNNSAYMGALPTATLGLPAAYAADAWDNKFLYAVSAGHVSGAGSYAGILTGTALSGDATHIKLDASASKVVDAYKGLNITIAAGSSSSAIITAYDGTNQTATVSSNWSTPPTATTTYVIANGNTGSIAIRYGDLTTNYAITTGLNGAGAAATYVVLSHGPDGKGGYPLNGTAVANACPPLTATSPIDSENCDDTNLTFYDTEYNDGTQPASFFDDYIIWGSNMLSLAPMDSANPNRSTGIGMGCSGPCEPWCAQCTNGSPFSSDNKVFSYACPGAVTSYVPSCKAFCGYAAFGGGQSTPCPSN